MAWKDEGEAGLNYASNKISDYDGSYAATAAFTDVLTMSYTTIAALSALLIQVSVGGTKTANTGNGFIRVLLNGVEVLQGSASAPAGFGITISDFALVNVAAGTHEIKLQAKYNTLGFTIDTSIEDVHARLLVKEVPR